MVITPLDQGSNRVEIQCKPELNEPLEHIKVRKEIYLFPLWLQDKSGKILPKTPRNRAFWEKVKM